MLSRWKVILGNWINCYFKKSREDEQNVNIESLLSIISHLRENLNLDESKSSILEANTIEEFICEKYPEFKFENGTVEAANEEEICLSASLLLYFVCVNSKNFDMKNAMCSNLSPEDQETILKFSKCLMECPVISVREVQAAITEACGQDIAAMAPPHQFMVAETPPALRSLHGEVRRLQAALDAERFDRNYLQEELLRNHGRLERLLKEKEQYKLDILNLKAKISLCCGDEADVKNAEVAADKTSKLSRQLQQLEAKLDETQTKLEDVIYERDSYKAKMDELKNERDKWLALTQEENARVIQLTKELDSEKHQVLSLKDLVAELEQHNKLNRLDSSSLECDDPDASSISLRHNSSICSEACANVVEVQLSEERAKIVVLEEQIHMLQVQLNELELMKEIEKKTLENVVAQRENEIFNLKHRINEEIEEKNKIKCHCDNEMTKLNNKINELEQNLKDNNEYSRSIIEKKMEEIQTLQEEKLSLINSLNNETSRMENIIKDLKSELDSEKHSRSTMVEGYQNHLMKLNEKVLNRNNELVELQNSNFEKGEKIETLQIELRKEKDACNDYRNKYCDLEEQKRSVENDLRSKREEIQNLNFKIQHNSKVIENMQKEVEALKKSVCSLSENCKTLESVKQQLLDEIRNRDTKIEETLKDINHVNEVFTNEKQKLMQDLDERNETVISLQTQLQNEISFKVELQNELAVLNTAKKTLSEELEKTNSELAKLRIEIEDKDRTMDLYIEEQKKSIEQANIKIQKLTADMNTKENDLKALNNNLEGVTKSLHDEVKKSEKNAEISMNKLIAEKAERETIQSQLNLALKEKSHIEQVLSLKCKEISMLQDKCEELTQRLEETVLLLRTFEQKYHGECKKNDDLNLKCVAEMSAIQTKATKMQNIVIEATDIMDRKIKDKESHLHKLGNDLETIKKAYQKTIHNLQKIQIENQTLVLKLKEELTHKMKLEEDHRNVNTQFDSLKALVEKMHIESQTKSEHLHQKETTAQELQNKIDELKLIKANMELHLNEEIATKVQAICALEKENETLHSMIINESNRYEDVIKEKNAIIDRLEHELNNSIIQVKHSSQFTEELKISFENHKAEATKTLKEKGDKIMKLHEVTLTLEEKIRHLEQEKATLIKQIVEIKEEEKNKVEILKSDEKALRDVLESEKKLLLSEKENLLSEQLLLRQELTEQRSIKMNIENEKAILLTEQDNIIQEKMALAQKLEQEKNVLICECARIEQELNKQMEKNNSLIQERNVLAQQLVKEKSSKEITEKEKELLVAEKELQKETIIENEMTRSSLFQEIDTLNSRIELLQREVTLKNDDIIKLNEEIKYLNENVDKQKALNEKLLRKNHQLLTENDRLNKDLLVFAKMESEIINKEKELTSLLETYDKLKQMFESNEKEYNHLLKEKEKLLLDLNNVHEVLKSERKSFAKTLEIEKTILEQIKTEKNESIMELEQGLINKEKDKINLLDKIEKLTLTVGEQKLLIDTLTKEKDLIISEKESLVTSLDVEKCSRDEMETEKQDLKLMLEDLKLKLNKYEDVCSSYVSDVARKESEAKQFEIALKQLEADHQNLLKNNLKIQKAISDSFDKLVQKLYNENVNNESLQKLINDKNFKGLPLADGCELISNAVDVLASEVILLKKLEVALKSENVALSIMQDTLKQKDVQVIELQSEVKRLEQVVEKYKIDLTKQSEVYATSMNSKIIDIQSLQEENQILHGELDEVKTQLEMKVHSLEDKLTESENLTEKLKKSYENQIENLNAMMTKLSNYLKEKTTDLEALRKDKDLLQQTVGDSCKVIKALEEEVKTEKQNIINLMSDFESERQILKNMVTVTESVMADTKLSLNNEISEHLIAKDCLEMEKKELQTLLNELEMKYRAQQMAYESVLSLLRLERKAKQDVERESEIVRDYLDEVIGYLSKERNTNISVISALEFQEKILAGDYEKMKNDLEVTQNINGELKMALKALERELHTLNDELNNVKQEKSQVENNLITNTDKLANVTEEKSQVEKAFQDTTQNLNIVQLEIKELKSKISDLLNQKKNLEIEKQACLVKIEELKAKIIDSESREKEELAQLKSENQQLLSTIEENQTVITNLEQLIKHELEENHKLRDHNEQEKLIMASKCSMLQDNHAKTEKELEHRQKEIETLRTEVETLKRKVELCEHDCSAKDRFISKISKDKDAVISTISKELTEERAIREKYEQELQTQKSIVNELSNKLEINTLKRKNEQLIRAVGQQETITALEKASEKYARLPEHRDHPQVDNSSSDYTHSSDESLKTITDLEKIIHDKNRTITTLQTDITYMKSLMAESETKLLDVNKELEVTKENCLQLSSQLKKAVYQKNEEIAELKKQVMKMSATENRASQIIKVSAKYQAMILKRIAEIKSNTVLKELANFGNVNRDNDLKRSLAGTITMEDLETFLDTTDRHLRRCSEKQIALQKERDRLCEINRINESEIINLKKFLTELSVSFQTFSSVKDLYGNKLSRVISVQRTVRREILNLDGRISDATMCKLERGYGAAMQDLSECTMNLERWVERCISRTVSVEKIKQAFTSDSERSSLATPSFQNTGLEIQLEELEKSFQKLLEEVARAVKGEGSKESQASTVMEVRAEYEDKLNRMKAKMKELFNEQMALLKNKQREEIALLERELQKTRDRMEESKRAYENHIKELTKELWNVGEKYLVKNDEAEWLRKKQRSGSLMSLQHVHSSGLISRQEPTARRPSDAHSLRSLPVADNNPKTKPEGRTLHMSDEEGEVFDNRWLKELSATPRRDLPPEQRLSELKWRNSLCPPHLKSSYPAETQFAPVLDEDDIKAVSLGPAGKSTQRKEVGITAYKKPGPPTPSKQAGRLSATSSELRESLRVEGDPQSHSGRKTSTPARFRAFLRFNKNDTNEGTPRARRLSNIFKKK